MGVTGLWRLIEPAGKPVPVETLENKILAVDISIWLHQMVKGYQDAKGAPLPNAHLIGLFQRLCKLLYFRIKPVFVFDGGFPELKKETIGKRQDNKAKYNSESERLKREIALLLGKKTAIGALLGKQIPQKKNNPDENDDMFKLPALPEKEPESESESEDETTSSASSIDLHTVDLESDTFKNLPSKDKYDLLVELKETRKMNSWGKLHTLPKKSDNFSDFQMQRLLKRRKVQECLEETEKEMGEGGMSMKELESLLNEEGIDTKIESLPSRRIASNETTRYVLISSVRQALADAKKKKEREAAKEEKKPDILNSNLKDVPGNESELEADLQKAIKMSLECIEDDPPASTSKTDDSWTSNFSDYSDSEDDDGFVASDMSSAKAYIMQYSDFTEGAINKLVTSKRKEKEIPLSSKVDKIIEELHEEKSIIEAKMELSSSEDDFTKERTNILVPVCSTPSKENPILKNNTQICILKNKDVMSFGPNDDKNNKPISTSSNFERVSTNINKLNNDDNCDNETENLNINDNQTSVILVEKKDKIIVLDSSCEIKENSIENKESESSDDDFEEVTETDNKLKDPIVQLTLNMPEEVEDDIFADLFNENVGSQTKSEEIKNWSEDTNNKNECKNVTKPIKEIPKHSSPKISDVNCTVASKNDQTTPCFDKNISINPLNDVPCKESNIINKEKLSSIVSDIENKEDDLLQEKGRLDRIGRNITEQMTKEAQELLQIFGIPYIVAPMEAEAQCAFLESIKLTDGTITDDSDIWLFGGQTVYKNFFNQKKLVLQYLGERIEKSFNLNREHLILFALLVGSDYTTGITGVGPVTALEILSSFPFNKKKLLSESTKQARYQEIVNGLVEFKKWVKAGKRTDNISLKKKLKNVNLTDDFPSIRVVQAYLDPNIEKSEEKFMWGELDITILRDYTKAKFGWSQNKLDEIIKPVLKRMQDRKNQKTVHDYFKRKTDFQSLEDQMSKRVKAAVQKMGPYVPLDDTPEKGIVKKKTVRKRKTKDTIDDKVPSETKRKKDPDNISNIPEVVNTQEVNDKEQQFNINLTKIQRMQEVIPQREKDKQSMLQNKLKAIEAFRKNKIDRKTKASKRRLPKPKDKAELSESSDTN